MGESDQAPVHADLRNPILEADDLTFPVCTSAQREGKEIVTSMKL